MKLRIRGDSLRLRLTRPEVAQLAAVGRLEETTHFATSAAFTYAVHLDAEGDVIRATCEPHAIVVHLPSARARAWCAADDAGVGLEATAGPLRVLVEKDWACVQPRTDEDPAEMYPHGGTPK